MKTLYFISDTFVAGIWGITIVDLLGLSDVFGFIGDGVKIVFAIAGLFYLLFIKIPHELKMNREKLNEKREQIKILKRENEK